VNIAGRTFLITGGGSGLGAASARRLVAAGGRVVLADVNRAAVEAVAVELGGAARAAVADVTDAAGVQAAVQLALSTFGNLSGAVNCAGVALGMRVLGKDGPHDLAAFARVIQVNLIGTFNVVRLAAAAIERGAADENGERGVIVNTASCAAFEGQIGQAAYSASKAGVAGMTLPIARELARCGIRVVTIAPGVFETPMMAGMPEGVRRSLAAQVPFPPRLGRPAEYAALAQHVIENPMLNGAVLRLDGALRMGPK
jgi:NAD(P)-dependent dehydrogenase (short-subunit alcohol dehydrogenase family)